MNLNVQINEFVEKSQFSSSVPEDSVGCAVLEPYGSYMYCTSDGPAPRVEEAEEVIGPHFTNSYL